MVIYELGIINNGVPLISKQYYEEHSMPVDPILRSGFLSALNSFAAQAFSDEIESFSMKNFKIVLLTHRIDETETENIISYCIGDKKLNLKLAKRALTKIIEEFIDKYGSIDLSRDLSEYDEFIPIFDKILGDLVKKPEDRLKSIFG
ncbi:MAG: hypothetical protein ACTSQO_00930 [Candidatus Helarchaeota archaeon]